MGAKEKKPTIGMRIAVVELAQESNIIKSKLAKAFEISRQSIDNWINIYKKSGHEGLVNSYKGGLANGRKENADNLPVGNKARILEEERRKKREEEQKGQVDVNLFFKEEGEETEPADAFNETHDFQESRYAGGFLYWGVLQHFFGFMDLAQSFLGKAVWPLYLFAMMMVHRIESVEALKTVFKREFGIVTGVKQLFSKPILWEKIHLACSKAASKELIKSFFKRQARLGLVALCWLYIDGHFIPYYGNSRVRKGFFTQRDQAMPGQTALYTHDAKGRIVYFEIQEGKGDLKAMMLKMSQQWTEYTGGVPPLIVADREAWGVEHFLEMKGCRFVTWEKNTVPGDLAGLKPEDFGPVFEVNNREYQALEENKTYKNDKGSSIELRRVIIWNKQTNRRVACVAQDDKEDTISIATAMLGRWGSSENAFKHMGERLNMHYNPVIDISEDSDNQKIANPEYTSLKKKTAELKKKLSKCERSLGKLPLTTKKDGSLRKSDRREQLTREREELLGELREAKKLLQDCPERVDLQEISEDSFKKINTEGKNLWDLVQSQIWNGRKKLLEMFSEYLPDQRDLIPAFEAVTGCKGWVKSTSETIQVRLEPLETPRFHAAQVQLCRALNEKKIRLPNGKLLMYDVGSAPAAVSKKNGVLS